MNSREISNRTFREISTTANFHRKLGEKLVKSANNGKGQQNKRTSPLHTRPKVNNTNGSEQSNSNTSRTNTTTFGVNRKSSYKNKGE